MANRFKKYLNDAGIGTGEVKSLVLGNNYTGVAYCLIKNGICTVSIEITPKSTITSQEVILRDLPTPLRNTTIYLSLQAGNKNYSAVISSGNLEMYFPSTSEPARIDCMFTYVIN